MKYCLIFLTSLLVSINAVAQTFVISGKVSGPVGPLENVWVTEVDINNRSLNSTQTDPQGFFNLKIRGGKTFLRITADGMRRVTQRIGSKRSFNIQMEKAADVDLTDRFSRTNLETNKLVYGISQLQRIRQWTWLEQVNDTLFAISVPVRVNSAVEEYPAGRQMQILDSRGAIMVTCNNMFTEIVQDGTPDSYEAHITAKSNNGNHTTTLAGDSQTDYFCYPRFTISKSDVEYIIDNADNISRFAVDTARGDNYWILYPDKRFGPELQKMINKLLK